MTHPIAPPPYYHGTKADLRIGDELVPGFASNFAKGKPLSWIYFSAAIESAVWGCELARGEGRERIYIVEPLGAVENDPNLTDKKFPGNPTKSYRSQAPLRVVGELDNWEPHPPEQLQAMKDALERMKADGTGIIID